MMVERLKYKQTHSAEDNHSNDLKYLWKKNLNELKKQAGELTKSKFGSLTKNYAVIEFSNYCESECLYCSYRESNIFTKRFRLAPEDIIQKAIKSSKIGIKRLVLQSGVDNYYDTDIISYIIYRIKKETDLIIYLALGERTFDEYRNWKIAGATGYFLKFETFNEKIIDSLNCKNFFTNKLNNLNYLRNIGFEVGTGPIIGLPETTDEDVLTDLLILKDIAPDHILIDPFIPKPFTPFQKCEPADKTQFLKSIAVSRIILPESNILSNLFLCKDEESIIEEVEAYGTNILLKAFK